MSDVAPSDGTPPIAVSPDGRFHYVPDELLVLGTQARDRALRLARGARADAQEGDWFVIRGAARPLAVVEALRAEGLVAQPNHVYWSHGCGSPCPPHPAYAHHALHMAGSPFWGNPLSGNPLSGNPLSGNPLSGNPLSGNPLSGNPLSGNPLSGNPLSGNPLSGNKPPLNTARPVPPQNPAPRTLRGAGTHPSIRILDTGLASPRPPLLAGTSTNTTAGKITGDDDAADDQIIGLDGNATGPDKYLDPVAGHGTFIAGLIELLAPGCPIHVRRVLTPLGHVSESDVAAAIHAAMTGKDGASAPQIIGLSLGGPVLEQPFQLRTAIAHARSKGALVVASAGNAGTCAPSYPAALPSVIAVGALGPLGPAPWSNYGDWVDACAPGTDLVSAFFAGFDGDMEEINSVDPDEFDGWAQWSGTSFAVPVVIAALAREMVAGNCDANEAERRVLRAPHLLRIPCFGTVVNL